jgi:hypothetical protein
LGRFNQLSLLQGRAAKKQPLEVPFEADVRLHEDTNPIRIQASDCRPMILTLSFELGRKRQFQRLTHRYLSVLRPRKKLGPFVLATEGQEQEADSPSPSSVSLSRAHL